MEGSAEDRICEEHACLDPAVQKITVQRGSPSFDFSLDFVVCRRHADEYDRGALVDMYYEPGQPRVALVLKARD